MQIKNRKKLILIIFSFLFLFHLNLNAEEFTITAKEIIIDKEKEIITGKGSVKAIDTTGKIILADKIIYNKSKEFLTSEGNVNITNSKGNNLVTEKATYDKINGIIKTYENTEIRLNESYKLLSKNIIYDVEKKIISSKHDSILKDGDGNVIETTMFQYNINDSLFSSLGLIKIIDINKNRYFFKEFHADTSKKEMIGSDVSVVLDQKNFGVSEESDPRFVANDIFASKDKLNLSKGVFTVCKKRDGKCPPWSIKAKKITHDRIKKTIYYEHATLKVYDLPVFYFPRFFHPDPTVSRQSGFLAPFFTNSTTVGAGFGLPYYWAMKNDRDLTFTPKIYGKENALFLNEYRRAFKNGFLTFDTSYTQGYKETTAKKTDGSRNHIFADLIFNFGDSEDYESNLSLKVQRTSNDTYFRIHDINTSLVDADDTDLKSELEYNYNKNDMYLSVSASVYENLREKTNSRYEYILPNIMYGKTFFTENFGTVDFKSNAVYNNYDTNKHKTFLTNDFIWNSDSKITKKGFVNTIQGMIRNTNYEAKKTADYRNDETINELHSVIAYKSSLPMKKIGENYSNIFSPIFMARYAPGHMRNLSDKDVKLNYTNLYSLNKTSEIESGLSAIFGFDYKVNHNESDSQKLAVSLGQVFNQEKNDDIPTKSSLNRKRSDVVGEFNYNFSEIGNIDYKFSVDNSLNNLNYNEVSTDLNFGRVQFNFEYLEEQNYIGDEHYASSGISLNFNDNNKLSFSTKKNFKTESTELYDLSYQYAIDCLTAGLVYRREFYRDDDDLEPKDSLMFTFTFVPFTSVNTPALAQ